MNWISRNSQPNQTKEGAQMGFSIEKHNEMGLELVELHNRMLQMMEAIYENYPKDSKVWARANRAAGAIMELRCELYACVSREHGGKEEFDPFNAYFSNVKEKKIKVPQPLLPSPEYRQ
ncbi:MAG: hypothetical protein ACOCTS_00925 [Thermodesulfobacteriota bacterium]